MQDIEKVHSIVLNVLEEHPETRDSDPKLFVLVAKKVNPIACSMSLSNAMWNSDEFDLPNYETVSRARRKIQGERADLKAKKEVQDGRKVNEEHIRAYAQKKVQQ